VVSYTAINGCVSSKTVRVLDTIILPDIDTICRTERVFLEADPYGGRWSGPGIVNTVNGRLDGWRPQAGNTYTYRYQLEGCSEEMEIHIRDIQAGPDRTRCLGDSLLYVGFPGNWSGPGPYIDSIQAFDISGLGPGEHRFTFSERGCSDRFDLQLVDVRIEEENPLFFCLIDDTIALDEYIAFFPSDGNLSGPGVFEIDDRFYYNPMLSGSGTHALSWDALGCSDTLWIEVEAPASIPQYSFCDLSTAQVLTATPSGGSWRGPGFLDEAAGLIDPQSLPIGTYSIYYTAPSGCETEAEVEIFEFEEAEFINVAQQYCFTDSLISISVQPAGGVFSINGNPSDLAFQPAVLGTGNHELVYERGTGACASSDRIFISILPPIEGEVFASNDSLCPEQSAEISVSSTGGRGQLTTTWDRGLGFGSSHIIRPSGSGWYSVRVEDECSIPFEDSIFIFQYPAFTYDEVQGPPVCFTDSTFAEITLDTSDYLIEWAVDGPQYGSRYTGPPGLYTVEITELESGCVQADFIELPGSPPIQANMTLIPNQDCINTIENEIEVIDLSVGYTQGRIDFGDGSRQVNFEVGANLRHSYLDTGVFEINLWIENELGCIDSITRQICVEHISRVFVPNVFSPNEDGTNDEFYFTSYGIRDVEWAIYNRYGEQMYISQSQFDRWDGTYKGKRLDTGVYVVRISYTDIGTGERGHYHGSVTLVR
jgi:gliding motility-associated-like protein